MIDMGKLNVGTPGALFYDTALVGKMRDFVKKAVQREVQYQLNIFEEIALVRYAVLERIEYYNAVCEAGGNQQAKLTALQMVVETAKDVANLVAIANKALLQAEQGHGRGNKQVFSRATQLEFIARMGEVARETMRQAKIDSDVMELLEFRWRNVARQLDDKPIGTRLTPDKVQEAILGMDKSIGRG